MKRFPLATVSSAFSSKQGPATARLGGIQVYARSERDLAEGLAFSISAIERISSRYLTTARNVLGKALRDELEVELMDKRLQSALLGHALRHGVIDAITILSKNDLSFRVFFQASKRTELNSAIEWARNRGASKGSIEITDVEQHLFGQRRYNSWSSSSHVIGRLSYLGIVRFVSDFSAKFVALPNAK